MSEKKQLGIFWGSQSFYFVEAEKNVPTKVFRTPFYLTKDIASSGHKESLEGMKLTENIQKAIRDNEILYSHVKLSLPTKNIIFRSFVIPWMQASEIAGVVEFEASKYIPFKMEDLFYQYHAVTITENRRKKIQILFVAIRKDVLDNYCSVFQHSGLQVDAIEPAPISLLRTLTLNKQMPKNQTVAIIETDKTAGRIIVVENDFPRFVREFQLSLTKEQESNPEDVLQARLFNETRISLDYYGRQHAHKKVDKIILLSATEDETLSNSLNEYLDIPTKNLNVNKFFAEEAIAQTGFVNAYGICLRTTVLPSIDFNFLPKHVSTEVEEEPGMGEPNYVLTGIVSFVCLCVLISSIVFSNFRLKSLEKREQSLKDMLGPKAISSSEAIDTQTKELTDKLDSYRIIRLESNVSELMTIVSNLLPKQAWLSSFSIKYKDNRAVVKEKIPMDLTLTGYVFAESESEQVRIANRLLQKLKKDGNFSKFFKNITLKSLKRGKFETYTTRSFTIVCE